MQWLLPAGCTRATQSLAHILQLGSSAPEAQLEPLPSSCQGFFVVVAFCFCSFVFCFFFFHLEKGYCIN